MNSSKQDAATVVLLKKRIADLKNIKEIQCTKGNYDVDNYMHGLANGLTLALAIMEGKDPEFIDAPDGSLDDLQERINKATPL